MALPILSCNLCMSASSKVPLSDNISTKTRMQERSLRSHLNRINQMRVELEKVVEMICENTSVRTQEIKKCKYDTESFERVSQEGSLLATSIKLTLDNQMEKSETRLQMMFRQISGKIDSIASKDHNKKDIKTASVDEVPLWYQALNSEVGAEITKEINKILQEGRDKLNDILSQNIRHPEEKSIFDQKFGDKNIDQEEHVYKKQNTKETQLTKEAGKAQNFSAGTVISNAATSILGAQAAGGVIGAGAVYTGAVEVIVPAAAAVSAEVMGAQAVLLGATFGGLATAGVLTGVASIGLVGVYINKHLHMMKTKKLLIEHLKKLYKEGNQEYVKILSSEMDKLLKKLINTMCDIAIHSIQDTAKKAQDEIKVAMDFRVSA